MPNLSIIFQSTPSLRTPYPTSSAGYGEIASNGRARPVPSISRAGLGLSIGGDDEGPSIELLDRELVGEGGGKALDGNLAIGRRDLRGVDFPLCL